ncbi:MAG: ATP-binding cassette domain-containing protein [Microthrixaceae bacterium]|nr:ATP-binding cassette domain-containing protein [Microthrixaceae bacterium]
MAEVADATGATKPARSPIQRVADLTGTHPALRWASIAALFALVWGAFALFAPRGALPGNVLQGIVLGSATALTSLGLILVWRANRFVNFAQMTMGGTVGLTAINLFLKSGWPYLLALFVGLVGGVALGAAVERLIVRRFSNATRLVLTVASLGIAQLLGGIELLLPKWMYNETSIVMGAFPTPFSGELFTLSSIRFGGDYLIIVAVVPIVALGLAWVLGRTSAGIAIRAAAENNDRALLLGIPVASLHTLVWAIAGGLATLTYLLQAPISGAVTSAALGPTVLLPALTAALIARMESMPTAVVAAMGLGALDGVIRLNWADETTAVVNLVIILAALMWQRSGTSRAHDLDGTWQDSAGLRPLRPEVGSLPVVRVLRWASIALLSAALVAFPFVFSVSTLNATSASMIWAMVAVSLVVLTGWNGQISLGQFAIVGVGAMVAGNFMSRWNTDLFLSLIAATVGGMLTALILGVPALRIKGPFLAVVTLSFAAALDSYFLNPEIFPEIVPQQVNRPILWDRFKLEDERVMYFLCLSGLLLAVMFARGARRARSGRLLLASRDNRKAAEAMSVNARRMSLQGFLLAGAIAGLAGGLHLVLMWGAGRSSYQPIMSIEVFSATTIGGLGSIGGAIFGAVGMHTLAGELPESGKLMLNGVGLLAVLYLLPGGLASGFGRLRDLALAPLVRRAGLAPVVDFDAPTGADSAGSGSGGAGGAGSGGTGSGGAGGDVGQGAPPAVAAHGIDVSYGSLQVLFGVDLEVQQGEMVALLGTNGAGKSTLLKAICGLTKSSGSIVLNTADGPVDLSGRRADRIVRDGIALMPGGKSIFPTLTVREHFRLASWTFRDDADRIEQDTARMLAVFPVLQRLEGRLAGDLSGGEQQQLALAQTLMLRPKVLMIDELSLGLAPGVVASLLEVVRALHAQGMTIILVEQSVNIALTLAERAVFMEKGAVRFEGPTRELLDRPDILRAVFLNGADAAGAAGDAGAGDASGVPGEPAREIDVDLTQNGAAAFAMRSHRVDPVPVDPDRIVLEAAGVTKKFGGVVAVDSVDLSVRAGTIVGLVGQNGAGKTTLLDCISGFHAIDHGRLMLRGHDVTDWAPHERARGRMGRSFQEARLFPSLTVAETVAVAYERNVMSQSMAADVLYQPASYESGLDTDERVDEILVLLNLDEHRYKLTSELSTGMRRIVELACLLAADPVVLLLDEPSAGVAQRDAEALGPLLMRVRDATGAALVVIEHDMPLLTSICDEMVALELGAVIARGTPEMVLSNERVISGYLGTDSSTIARSGTAS